MQHHRLAGRHVDARQARQRRREEGALLLPIVVFRGIFQNGDDMAPVRGGAYLRAMLARQKGRLGRIDRPFFQRVQVEFM